MDIKTKYNPKDLVLFIDRNRGKVSMEPIDSITIQVDKEGGIEIKYWLPKSGLFYKEDQLFATKEELIKSL